MQTRTLEEVRTAGDLTWFAPALDAVRMSLGDAGTPAAGFLSADQPVTIARAPGRLDVMGGIADYSGSLVLELPLACATFAIAQPQHARRLDVLSVRLEQPFAFSIDFEELRRDLEPMVGGRSPVRSESQVVSTPVASDSPTGSRQTGHSRPTDDSFGELHEQARTSLMSDNRWVAYIAGVVYRCLTLAGLTQSPHGLRLLIVSDVPEGKGVSSSAALEVAAMAATAAAYDIHMTGTALAAACQWAENHIAGAPCGIMDQMTSTLGQRDRLLSLLCQPATVQGHVSIPAGYRFYGIDSGIRHAVTGADYGTVRTAAYMGYRMIAAIAGLRARSGDGTTQIEDDRWHGYVANIAPSEFAARFADSLPVWMNGAEFLTRYGGITDSVTRVDPLGSYPVRLATSHPVYEHDRVARFAQLLETTADDRDAAREMGALMIASHASYGACGLGSDGTDRLVELVTDAGAARGLFGAKITGGGSGGTVAVLGTDTARRAVHDIADQYRRETGREAHVFEGSSPGAEVLGVLRLESAALTDP